MDSIRETNPKMTQKLSQNGMINEGIIATKLGLQGIPEIAEQVIIERDLTMLENILSDTIPNVDLFSNKMGIKAKFHFARRAITSVEKFFITSVRIKTCL